MDGSKSSPGPTINTISPSRRRFPSPWQCGTKPPRCDLRSGSLWGGAKPAAHAPVVTENGSTDCCKLIARHSPHSGDALRSNPASSRAVPRLMPYARTLRLRVQRVEQASNSKVNIPLPEPDTAGHDSRISLAVSFANLPTRRTPYGPRIPVQRPMASVGRPFGIEHIGTLGTTQAAFHVDNALPRESPAPVLAWATQPHAKAEPRPSVLGTH